MKWSRRVRVVVGDNQARDQIVTGEMASTNRAKYSAIRALRCMRSARIRLRSASRLLMFSLRYSPNVYESAQWLTNTAYSPHRRGQRLSWAGRPEGDYLIERLIDELRSKPDSSSGDQPAQSHPPKAMPYTDGDRLVYDSGEFDASRQMPGSGGLEGFAGAGRRSKKNGKAQGTLDQLLHRAAGHDNERMELRFDPGGTITIWQALILTARATRRFTRRWCRMSRRTIRGYPLVQGDTDKVAFGRGTYGARSSMNGGAALRGAADVIISKARLMAAALMEADSGDIQFAEGEFRIVGTDRFLPLVEVAKAFYYPGGITDKFGVGLEGSGAYGTNPPNNPNGCHICEVEVDPDTGATTIERYTVIDDAGRVINPLLCEGQVHGGVVQGIGQALMEHIVYDPESGQNLTASFMDYAMPHAHDVPSFATGFEEIPCTTNPLGVKGIGEAGAIGTPPAVINAILDALRPLGVTHIDMPATPMRVWGAISRAERGRL